MLRLAIVVLIGSSTAAHAGQATCSNPGLPVGASASSELLPGRLTTSLTTGWLHISDEQTLPSPAGYLRYDARLELVETRLANEYTISPSLAVGLVLPYRVADEHVQYRDPTTGAIVTPPPVEAIHARTETLHGIGDPTLYLHLARELGPVRMHARVGATIPLGNTVPDPFVLADMGLEHEHIQFGTGTVVPFIAVEAQHDLSRDVTLTSFALLYASLYENDQGYRIGQRISGGVTASSGLGTHAWTFSAAVEAHGETAEKWHGIIHDDEGNAGRLDVYGGGGAAWRPTNRLAVTAEVRVPMYEYVVGDQVHYSFVASAGVIGTFDIAPRASWHGLDEAPAGPPGSAPVLVPVPGKTTVFDFYAEWCPPCRVLDGELVALARRYPDKLAVRKLDVVDADSEAWQKYLLPGAFDLPHVKVYGPDGSILFERTAAPHELVRTIEDTLK